jgi:PASTA domain
MTRTHRLIGLAGIAVATATVAAGVSSAQPPDPGWVGIPHCSVPNVTGLQLTAAKRKLVSARCRPGFITRKRSSAKKNRVILQVPIAGTQCAPKTEIDLQVSRGRR